MQVMSEAVDWVTAHHGGAGLQSSELAARPPAPAVDWVTAHHGEAVQQSSEKAARPAALAVDWVTAHHGGVGHQSSETDRRLSASVCKEESQSTTTTTMRPQSLIRMALCNASPTGGTLPSPASLPLQRVAGVVSADDQVRREDADTSCVKTYDS